MKKLMIGVGLATIVATSAMAQSYQPEVGSGNIVPNGQYNNTSRSGDNAFAYQRTVQHHRAHHDSMDRD
jgi:opacity protein-like surface antigen